MQNQVDQSLYPETSRFLNWYEAEKAKGLVDVKFFPFNLSESNSESFFTEVNRAIEATDVPDAAIF